MIEINKDNFEAEIKTQSGAAVLDFWGPQCGPCLALMPDVEALAKEMDGKVKFGKVNASENRRFCMSLKVMALPTFLFMKDGEVVDRLADDDVTIEGIKTKAEALL